MRPLARHLGVKWLIANRLGVSRPHRHRPAAGSGDPSAGPVRSHYRRRTRWNRVRPNGWCANWRCRTQDALRQAVIPAERQPVARPSPLVDFDRHSGSRVRLSVRNALAGKHVMLIGVTGFIGKVWLVNTLMDLPEIGRIYLLIRRQKIQPGPAAIREAGGRVAGIRSVV